MAGRASFLLMSPLKRLLTSARDVAKGGSNGAALTRRAAQLLAALTVSTVVACGEEPIVRPTRVGSVLSIIPVMQTLTTGDSAEFRIQHTPPREPLTIAACASSDTSVATIRQEISRCLVFGRAAGTASLLVRASTGQMISGQVTVVGR